MIFYSILNNSYLYNNMIMNCIGMIGSFRGVLLSMGIFIIDNNICSVLKLCPMLFM